MLITRAVAGVILGTQVYLLLCGLLSEACAAGRGAGALHNSLARLSPCVCIDTLMYVYMYITNTHI